jgi:hypothetical protein
MSRKKAKKAVKKIVASEVRWVPSAFSDDLFTKPSEKGFFFWPFLRFNFHEHCPPGSERSFWTLVIFQMFLLKFRKMLLLLLLLLLLLCSEHGPICHLFELILVIHVNTSNGTNHIV